jgi:hydroxymethylbilane synthase
MSNSKKLILGTRGSDLALYQANLIRYTLVNKQNCEVELKIIKTAGDMIDNMPFDKMEGKGFFTKEIEEALLSKEIDLAVHSLKDLMTTQPEGLKIGAVGFREDRREMLLIRKESRIQEGIIPVKEGGIIGTGSARRKCQIAFLSPSLNIKNLRGNVPTRINKLRNGEYDAIIIAAAGVKRLDLDLSDLEVIILDPDRFLPASGQGVLAIQIRNDEPDIETIVSRLNDNRVALEVSLERGLLSRFASGCSLPLGVNSEVTHSGFKLTSILGISDNNDNWIGLKCAEISGEDVSEVVEKSYKKLTG